MNIQIFGKNKCFDTKKAQRWFKERRIKFQMVDLKEKGLSRGEFDRVCQAVGGWQALVDETAKDQDTLALLRWLDDSQQLTNCLKTSSFCATHCTQWPRRHSGVPAGGLGEVGIKLGVRS